LLILFEWIMMIDECRMMDVASLSDFKSTNLYILNHSIDFLL